MEAVEADLFGAIERREGLRSIRQIVANNPQVLLEKSPQGRSPLHEAIFCGASLGVIRFLVEQRPHALQEKDYESCLPAHYAAIIEGTTLAVLRCVVEPYPQALLLLRGGYGYTPLHHAASAVISVAKVRYLVTTCPAAVRSRTGTGPLPLHLACRLLYRHKVRSLKIILLLVEGWPESILEADGRAPAWEDCLRHVTRWTDRDERYWTHYRRMVEGIFEMCPQAIRARGSTGLLPLQLAVSLDAPSWMVGYFLDLWPESILELSDSGMSILHVTAHHSKLITLERVRSLVERDSRIVALRSSGDNSFPLHAFASRDGPPPNVIRYLFEHHPPAIHEKDRDGRTPLHRAVGVPHAPYMCERRSPTEINQFSRETVEFLVSQRPASLHETDMGGDLPLHIAAQQSHQHFRPYLVECLARSAPATVEVTNPFGRTPLLMIAEWKDLPLVRMVAECCPNALLVEGTYSRSLPLHLVCSRIRGGDDEIAQVVQYFVELRPESVRHRENDGWFPLHCAAAAVRADLVLLEVVRILLAEYPEAARAATQRGGFLPLHLLLSARYLNTRQVLPLAQLLIEAYPESLQTKSKMGLVPVLVAASNPAASLDLLWHLLKGYPDSIPVPCEPQRHASSSSIGRSSKRPRLT